METETETETLKANGPWPMADSPCGIGQKCSQCSAGPLVSRHLCDQTGSRHLCHETPLTICGVLLSLSCFLSSGQEKIVHICWWKEHVEQERALLCKKACLPPSSSFAECLQGAAMATMTC